ncbi:cyclic nucleotide-binding protein [Marinicaulis flavus]|uniref:Cyclic nucleotide-binding protein n=2 Tax=Hyphococcus luteus TaxID=2058213 RepID=A0A2S7KBB0_9PROT|nr:cyclic nucleotide-binding protein [Marinicaulis flavus]
MALFCSPHPNASPDLPLFARMEFFVGLSPEGLNAVRASAHMEYVNKNDAIFAQGDNANRAFALAAGSVRIIQTGSDGKQAIIRFIAPGDLFGTVPLFTNNKLPADALAAERSLILSWSETDLFELIDRFPSIAVNIIRIIGARLAETQDRVRELATQCADQRIAHAILRLAAQAGHNVNGVTTIGIPLRRKDLAEFSGTTLHTASRTLAAWEKTGLLMSQDQHLTIRDISAIARIADKGGH